jgi:raffinose/stachyose/melibiose transport system substrate-binding protein
VGRKGWRKAVAAVGMAAAIGAVTAGAASAGTAGGIQTSGFGPSTLTIWSYDGVFPGSGTALKQLTADFEKKYPNVKVNLVFKDFNTLNETGARALASGSGPDIIEGNQGFQVDAQLVRAKLIIPLDKYIAAYHWQKWYSPGTWQVFKWTPDGRTFGEGPTWGVASTANSMLVYYNKQKLKQLGLPAKIPDTFAKFQALLAQVRAKLPSSQPVIEFGQKDISGEFIMSAIQGAYVKPASILNWIFHRPGATWDTPGNVKALTALQDFAKAGYFNSDSNSLTGEDAAQLFAKGHGVFFVDGNWSAAEVYSGLKQNAGVANMPGAAPGVFGGDGSISGPWHISSKSKVPDVAAAWLNYIISSPQAIKTWYQQQQVPSPGDAPLPTGNPYLSSVTAAWQAVVKNNGLFAYEDWASPTMIQTMTAQLQLLVSGHASPQSVAQAFQTDYSRFDKTLKH